LAAVFLVVAGLGYWALDAPLFLDDYTLLGKLDSPGGLRAAAWDLYDFTAEPREENTWLTWWASPTLKLHYIRPLSSLLLTAEFLVWGWWSAGYHAVTLLLFLGCCLLVHRLALRLSGSPVAALTAALAFAVHPVHLTGLLWVANRVDITCGLFVLGGMLAFERMLDPAVGRPARDGALTLLLLVCAMLAKESGVVLIPALFVLLWARNERPRSLRLRGLAIAAGGLILAALGSWVYRAAGGGVHSEYFLPVTLRGVALLSSLLKGLLLSLGALFFFLHASEPTKATMFTEQLGVTLGLLLAGLALLVLLLLLLRRDRMALGMLLLVVLWIGPSLLFLTGDRLLFLPSIPLALLLAGVIRRIERAPVGRRLRALLLVVVAAAEIAAPGIVLFRRLQERRELMQINRDVLTKQIEYHLGDGPRPKAIFFLNVPNGLSVLSLTDLLRKELDAPDLWAYALGAFTAPPEIGMRGSRQLLVRAPPGQAFFTTIEERVFLTGPSSVPALRYFPTRHFDASIKQMGPQGPTLMQFSLRDRAQSPDYAFFMLDENSLLVRIVPRVLQPTRRRSSPAGPALVEP
jgi:hypothetical protein